MRIYKRGTGGSMDYTRSVYLVISVLAIFLVVTITKPQWSPSSPDEVQTTEHAGSTPVKHQGRGHNLDPQGHDHGPRGHHENDGEKSQPGAKFLTRDTAPCSVQQRMQHIADYCSIFLKEPFGKKSNDIKYSYHYLIADSEHRALYCIVPKTGCTSIVNLIVNSASGYDGPMPLLDPHIVFEKDFLEQYPLTYVRPLDMMLPREANNLLGDPSYFKFTVVRHPYEKLYAAYVNKIINLEWYKDYLDAKLRELSIPKMTFETFIRILVDEWKRPPKSAFIQDVHWVSQFEVNQPCVVNYDYIAKLEYLTEEQGPIAERFGAEELPHYNVVTNITSSDSDTDEDWVQIINDLPSDLRLALYERYNLDFLIFGYDWDELVGPLCDVQGPDGVCC